MKTKPKQSVDIGRAISLMGQKKFNKEVFKQAQSGVPIIKAYEDVARLKFAGKI